MTPAARATRWLATGLAVALLLAGLALVAAGAVVPFDLVRGWLDQFAADGAADEYTPARHRAIAGRLRPAGIALLALGVLAGARRGTLAAGLARLALAAPRFARDLGGALRGLGAEPWPHRALLAAAVVVGAGLRLVYLDWPMRYDESYTVLHYARFPLVVGLTRYDAPNNHLLNTLLVHVALTWLGDAPWVVRLPAFLAGTLVLPATYGLTRHLFGSGPALLATAIVATALPAIEMSTNARGYAFVTLCVTLSLWLGGYLRRTGNAAGWAVFVALGTVGGYAMPTMVYGVAGVAAWLALSALAGDTGVPRRPFLRALGTAGAATFVLTAACYAPILLRADVATLLQSPTVASKTRMIPWPDVARGNLDKAVDTYRRWTGDLPGALRAVLLAAAVYSVAAHRRISPVRVPPALVLVATCALLVAAQRVVVFSRVWVLFFPLFAAQASAGLVAALAWLGPPRARLAAALATGLAGAWLVTQAPAVPGRTAYYRYNLPDFRDARAVVRFLAPRLQPGDQILLLGTSLAPFYYYGTLHGLPYVRYVFDYALRDWSELRRSRRIFAIVTEQDASLAAVLERAGLAGARPPPTLVARFPASQVYLLAGAP